MSPKFDRVEDRLHNKIAGKEIKYALFGGFVPWPESSPLKLSLEQGINEVTSRYTEETFEHSSEDPKAPFASALLEQVRALLGSEDVEFFTTVGSSLSFYDEIDGLLKYNGKFVTITLKTPTEFTNSNADCIQEVPDTGLEPGTPLFASTVEDLAAHCARKFKILTRSN
jgi:hypothetical protein